MNLVAIANACAVECVRQQVEMNGLRALLFAYDYAMRFKVTGEQINLGFILNLGGFVDDGNIGGFRKTPVTFARGGSALNANMIPEQMNNLVEAINYGPWDEYVAKRLVREFLYIHPFKDGNGRTAFVLYNFLMGTLDEPLALPDFDW